MHKEHQGGEISLKILPEERSDLRNASGRAGGGGQKIFIIGASLRKITQSHGVCAASLKDSECVRQFFVGGSHDGGEKPVVFTDPLLLLFGGDQVLRFESLQPFQEGGMQKMGSILQGVFVHNEGTGPDHLCGGCVGHKEPFFSLFLLVPDQTIKVGIRLIQNMQIIFHILFGAECIVGEKNRKA